MATANSYLTQPEEGFNLSDLFAFLWQKKFRIVLTAALVFVAGSYYVVNLPKIYVASGTLLLGGNNNRFGISANMGNFNPSDATQMDTYVEFIRSRQFVQSIVEELELTEYEQFQPKLAAANRTEKIEHAISVFQGNLTLERVGDTDLLKVSFSSQYPALAADVVNYLGPAFFVYHSSMSREKADDASKWLNTQLASLQTKLADAEQALQSFLRENRLIDVKSQIELARTEISALLNEKLQNDKLLAGVSATALQVREAGDNQQNLLQVPWILQNQQVIGIRSKVINQEQELNELAKRYKGKHHKYIAAATKLSSLQTEQNALLEKLVASLEQEFQTLQARSKSLDEQIEVAKAEHSDLGRHELQLARLRRNVDSTQQLYEVFLSRLQETEILKDIGNQEEFAVVDFANEPKRPAKPNIPILLVMVIIFSMTLSVGLWLFLHLLGDRQTRLTMMLRKIEIPLLAELPKLAKVKSPKQAGEFGQKSYTFSETIRSLRTSLMVRQGGKENRIIAVTSIKEGDGKSSVAISIAQSFAKLEKTLLLDTDLRAPSLATSFGLDKEHSGITDFLDRRVRFSDCKHKVDDTQLTLIPSGAIPADPMVYLSKSRFENIISKLGILYERVVVEAPSVNTYSDALILSRYVDGLILVCDTNTADSAELLEAVQRLQESGAPLMGVVFNKVKNVRRRGPHRSRTRAFFRGLLRW